MNTIALQLQPSIRFLYWLCWAFLIGGMLISGPLLAPLAFHQVPILVSPDDAAHSRTIISTLFTLFFSTFFPLCSISFLLMSLADVYQSERAFLLSKLGWVLIFLLLSGNLIWGYLGWVIAPEMKEIVFNPSNWQDSSQRVVFHDYHQLSRRLSEIGLGITLLLPWLNRRLRTQLIS